MIVTKYTTEDLKKLPLRAIVALSARCARRVEHLALLPDDHPETERRRSAVSNAIRLAEAFANGVACSSSESVVREVEASRAIAEHDLVRDSAMGTIVQAARAAANALDALDLRIEVNKSHVPGAAQTDPVPHLADVSANLAVRDAFSAALEADTAEGHADNFTKAVTEDYERLLRLELGSYPQAGKPIDPGSNGPLGPQELT